MALINFPYLPARFGCSISKMTSVLLARREPVPFRVVCEKGWVMGIWYGPGEEFIKFYSAPHIPKTGTVSTPRWTRLLKYMQA